MVQQNDQVTREDLLVGLIRNAQNITLVHAKSFKNKIQKGKDIQPDSDYFDIRDYWLKPVAPGDPEIAYPTKKGYMLRREAGPDVVLAMLKDLHPEDFEADTIERIQEEVTRLLGALADG